MKVVISKNKLFFIIALLILFEPGIFKNDEYALVNNLYSVFKSILFLALAILCLKNQCVSHLSMLIFIYECIFVISTVLNGNSLGVLAGSFLGPAMAAISISFLFDLFRDNLIDYVKSIRNILLIYYLLNIVSVISIYMTMGSPGNFTGDGIKNFFLGSDNRFVFYFVPGIICALIVAVNKNNKPDVIFWEILIQGTIILTFLWSVGAMIVMMAYLLFFLVKRKKAGSEILNIYTFLIIWIAINIALIVFVNTSYANQLLLWAEVYFQKGANLNIRFVMWRSALKEFYENPILGIGIKNIIQLRNILFGFAHTHNFFINILMRGGLVAICLLILILFASTKPVMELRNTYIGTCIAVCIFGCLVLSLADTYDDVYFWLILNIAYRIRWLIKDKKHSGYICGAENE